MDVAPPRDLAGSDIARILALATRAGSAANMQPWRFVWDGETLRVFLDPTREPSSVNHRRLASVLTFGGLLEHIDIAASVVARSVDIDVHLAETSDRADRPWASVRFQRPGRALDPLVSAIETRFTDRRAYLGGSLSDPIFEELRADASSYPGCALHLLPSAPDELLHYIADTEKFFSSRKEIHLQVLRAVRWSDREIAATRDGLPWKAMGVGYLESRILQLCRLWPVQALWNRLGYLSLVEQGVRAAFTSLAGLGLVTVRATSEQQVVQAARFATRAWLKLHHAGYGKQPYLAPSLFAYESLAGVLPERWPAAMHSRCHEGLTILRRAFTLPPEEIPLWLFRTGKSTGPLPRDWYTLRYPVDRILRIETPK